MGPHPIGLDYGLPSLGHFECGRGFLTSLVLIKRENLDRPPGIEGRQCAAATRSTSLRGAVPQGQDQLGCCPSGPGPARLLWIQPSFTPEQQVHWSPRCLLEAGASDRAEGLRCGIDKMVTEVTLSRTRGRAAAVPPIPPPPPP